MAIHALGPFSFVTFSRSALACPPAIPGEMVDIVQRPGCDGTDILFLGSKGEPFEMFSLVDCDTIQAAVDLQFAYNSLRSAGLNYTLIWNGVDYSLSGVRYVVLDVEAVASRKTGAAAGGLSTYKGAILQARWTLLPVEVS